LFNWLFTRKNNGKLFLRIEDTDKERSKIEFEEDIKESLSWLGINWDEFLRQSDRKEIHAKYITKLLETGAAYVSKDEPAYRTGRGEGKGEVIRFKNPGKKVKFNDIIRGDIEFETKDLGDFVIAKDIQTPLYHLAVVVDDADMKISHVIRGDDHISNTPRQILIQEALGFLRPQYAHIPLILGKDRSKLSKRDGAEAVADYRKMGYPPEAMFNFLGLLGWHPHDDREILTREELMGEFSLERVQKGGAVFDKEKLDWISREYIKNMPDEEFVERLKPFIPETKSVNIDKAAKLLKGRISKFSDFGVEVKSFFELEDYPKELLLWKGAAAEDTKRHLEKVSEILSSDGWDFEKAIMLYAEAAGKGNVLWPLRVALSGKEKSPGPFEILEVLGKEEALTRITKAIGKLANV